MKITLEITAKEITEIINSEPSQEEVNDFLMDLAKKKTILADFDKNSRR